MAHEDGNCPAGGGGFHLSRGGNDSARSLPPSRPNSPTDAPHELFPGCQLQMHVRRFGDVPVSYWLPCGLAEPIGWNSRGLERRKWFLTLTWLSYEYDPPDRPTDVEPYRLWIPPGYEFDGASIPRKLWGREGFAPVEAHMWAALPHDYVCDHPEILPRYAGDAIFGHVLDQLALENQLEVRHAIEFHGAVSVYSRLKHFFGISA